MCTVRYLSANVHSVYFRAMPKNAVTHIQKRAPGPPMRMASATPAMLPIPTVAESAVVRAWKCLTSPGSLGSSYLPRVMSIACLKPRTWMKPSLSVTKRPVPSSTIASNGACGGQFQTYPSRKEAIGPSTSVTTAEIA